MAVGFWCEQLGALLPSLGCQCWTAAGPSLLQLCELFMPQMAPPLGLHVLPELQANTDLYLQPIFSTFMQ
jgi:hypothetical protein